MGPFPIGGAWPAGWFPIASCMGEGRGACCPAIHLPGPTGPSLFAPLLTSLVPAALMIRLGALMEGHGTCPLAVLGPYPTGTMVWATGRRQPPWLPIWGRGHGVCSQPRSVSSWPKHPLCPLTRTCCAPTQAGPGALGWVWGVLLAKPTIQGYVPTSQGMGKQKRAFYMCSTF